MNLIQIIFMVLLVCNQLYTMNTVKIKDIPTLRTLTTEYIVDTIDQYPREQLQALPHELIERLSEHKDIPILEVYSEPKPEFRFIVEKQTIADFSYPKNEREHVKIGLTYELFFGNDCPCLLETIAHDNNDNNTISYRFNFRPAQTEGIPLLKNSESPILCFASHPNNKQLVAVGREDGTVTSLNVETGNFIMRYLHDTNIIQLGYDPSGTYIISRDTYANVCIWNQYKIGPCIRIIKPNVCVYGIENSLSESEILYIREPVVFSAIPEQYLNNQLSVEQRYLIIDLIWLNKALSKQKKFEEYITILEQVKKFEKAVKNSTFESIIQQALLHKVIKLKQAIKWQQLKSAPITMALQWLQPNRDNDNENN